ncbi:MAG: hypothetical protein EPO20_01190 [Betaproteobacteria bacterium]|nr:MAG: hypothetical protein EPO20_01190 [Betaproteobacteria bacterium]
MRLSISLRRYVAIAALAALSVLLLRPVCDVLTLHSTPSQAAPMASMHHDSHESVSAVASAAKAVALDAAPVGTLLVVPAFAFLSRVAAPDAAAPPSRSYYARSARILR